jgi:hypothetical protein
MIRVESKVNEITAWISIPKIYASQFIFNTSQFPEFIWLLPCHKITLETNNRGLEKNTLPISVYTVFRRLLWTE